jgi:phosphatidylinositol alpha-1,6-mannosyltransferase
MARLVASTPDVRVLVVTPDYPPTVGGIQVLTHGLVSHFSRVRPRVVTLATAGAEAFDRGAGVDVHRVRKWRESRRLSILALNAGAVRDAIAFRPHVLLSMHIVTGLSAFAAKELRGRPFIQYVYANELRARPRLAAFAVRHASAAVALSRYAEQLALAAGADPDTLERIPPAVELPHLAEEPRADRPTVLTVARLAAHKGHDVMLRALPMIVEQVPDVEWVIVGDGPERHTLEGRARERGMRDRVRFLGALPDRERDAWWERAHVFAMPNRLPAGGVGGEGFGIVFLEAAAHGLPVVAGGVGGALDAVIDGRTGVLVEPTDPVAVAQAVSALLLDPARARALGEAGRARAAGFSWPRVSRQVEDLILRLTA